jgi:hypothetical protein
MKTNSITLKHSIFIDRPRELVWDFTQNYNNRSKWDGSVLEAIILQSTPNRIVRLKLKANTILTFIYKLDDRPNKTTLVAKEISSSLIQSAGGSWIYEEQNDRTLWTQINTIGLKHNFLLPLLLPIYKWLFISQTKKAMNKAKKIIEQI